MDELLVTVSLAVVLAVLAARGAFPSMGRVAEAGKAFGERNLVAVSPRWVDAFEADVRRGRRRWVAVWVVAVAVAASSRLSLLVTNALTGAMLLGVVAWWGFDRLRGANREFVPNPNAALVARPKRVGVSDYVPLSVQAVPVIVALAAPTIVVVLMRGEQGAVTETSTWALLLLGATLVSALACGVAVWSRVLVARPQRAEDRTHLYLLDAWRSDRVVAGHLAPLFGLWLLVFLVLNNVEGDAASKVGVGAMAGAAAAGLWSVTRSTLWFRRRLWPELAPDEVLGIEVVA